MEGLTVLPPSVWDPQTRLEPPTKSMTVVSNASGVYFSIIFITVFLSSKFPANIQLASCLIYAWAPIEFVNFIMWVRSVNKMLPPVKFAEYMVLTFLILPEKC